MIRDVPNCCLLSTFTFFISFVLKITHDVGFIIVPLMGRDVVRGGGEFCSYVEALIPSTPECGCIWRQRL